MNLTWKSARTPEIFHAALRLLASEYSLIEDAEPSLGAISLEIIPGVPEICVAERSGDIVRIIGGTAPGVLRMVGAALGNMIPHGSKIAETCPFTTFGIMLDCSRNAVMRVEHVKRWMRRLALFGYNQIMLYTEDTYEIPGEPRFGYLRGRYGQSELRELDEYAAQLGIEMVACIQTLAHLQQILRWDEYSKIKDYGSTMLVGQPLTYELIGRMLDAMSGSIRSRRIHIGMDEAWELGRGAYLDQHGSRRGFDIFNEHLAKVIGMCRDRGLMPMIWSDMYFAMGSPSHGYYDTNCVIPPDVAAAIPKVAQLVYWDYYHDNAAFYRDWIGRHRAMGYEPVMASGIWTWSRLWYDRKFTEANAGACIEAAGVEGLREVIFTIWGDDGACCDIDSALAGIAWCAERTYSENPPNDADLAARFLAVCDADYQSVINACDLTDEWRTAAILWDDPILGIFANEGLAPDVASWEIVGSSFSKLAESLVAFSSQTEAGDLRHAQLLAKVLAGKIELREQLVAAYDTRDKLSLAAVQTAALEVAEIVDQLEASWRRGWMRRNKPQGYEVVQIRLAQQAIRHRELARRIGELLDGIVASIPELDERPGKPGQIGGGWQFLASGSAAI